MALIGFILAFMFPPLGMILSIVAKKKQSRSGGTIGGGGLAVAGIIIGAVFTGMIFFSVVGAILNEI
jgi:hypothetical protein